MRGHPSVVFSLVVDPRDCLSVVLNGLEQKRWIYVTSRVEGLVPLNVVLEVKGDEFLGEKDEGSRV